MTIERVLHVGSSTKMDFYDINYFSTYSVNPFTFTGIGLYGYGKELDTYQKPHRKVVDLTKYHQDYPSWTIGTTITNVDNYIVTNPYVPPSSVKTSPTEMINDPEYMNFILSYYNESTPRIISPHKARWSFPIEFADNDIKFYFGMFTVREDQTLPFVNGFACFPEVVDGKLVAKNGASYLKGKLTNNWKTGDMMDRNRSFVLMDFEPVGGCSFYKLSECEGNLNEFVLPITHDPSTTSMLLILDGRILLPYEYSIIGNHCIIDRRRLTVIPELDRKVCIGETIKNNTRIVSVEADEVRDLYNAENSFLVFINKPNLQIVEHKPWYSVQETTAKIGSNSYGSLDRNQFDQYARGLMFDKCTRSVYDYAREEHTTTFYTEGNGAEKHSWAVSTTHINPERPLVLLAGTRVNLMSAKAKIFDQAKDFYPDDTIVWPKFVLLDFIFRG